MSSGLPLSLPLPNNHPAPTPFVYCLSTPFSVIVEAEIREKQGYLEVGRRRNELEAWSALVALLFARTLNCPVLQAHKLEDAG